MNAKARRKSIFWCLVSGVTLTSILAFALALGYVFERKEPFDHSKFDAVAWRAMKDQDREHRAEMAHDLVRHYLKIGMSETEIKSLLGPPERILSQQEYNPPLPHDIDEYNMGRVPMDVAGEYYLLRLSFDGRGRFVSSEILRD